jgi:lipoic acid synthetase
MEALDSLLQAAPLAVFAHNVECVPRLDLLVRDPRASFSLSLQVLKQSKQLRPDVWTKSSLMVGLGETDEEVVEVLSSLRQVGVDLLTIGQYLAPGKPGERYRSVDRYVPPQQFEVWQSEALGMGFLAVAAGPLVRSSYRAGELLASANQSKPAH